MSSQKASKEIVQQVFAEIGEHLSEIEAILLRLDDDPGSVADIGELFRRMHTIKGISGVIDRPGVSEIAHRTESFLERIQKSGQAISSGDLDLLLQAKDLLGRAMAGESVDLDAFLKPAAESEAAPPPVPAPALQSEEGLEEEEAAEDVFLLFRAGGRLCAVPVGEVREISQILPWRQLPFTSPYLRGMTGLRGQLVPVLDLAKLVTLPHVEEPEGRILFLECGEELIGILVERVVGVTALPGWQGAVPALRHFGLEALEAVGAYHGEVVSVLSAERMVRLAERN